LRGVAPEQTSHELLESLERYKLVARLGQGGMAEVYLAAWEVAPFVHRPVVIKRLHPHFNEDPRLVQMFLDEARLLTLLDHPHVVKTLEAGVIDGRCCIAMEYLEGQPLHRVLRRAYQNGGLAPHLAVSIVSLVLDGLHYSHEIADAHGHALEIVHRDVSPQNVFVTNDGQVKVLDFGIAKAKNQEGRTATGIIKGKVGYIAPEQAAGEAVDRRADVWSAGVVLWEALTGTRLFKAETDAATLSLCLLGPLPSASSRRADLPAELDLVLSRALQRDRALRYQTASAMREDLESWLSRAGHARDPRALATLMKGLFESEIIEQERLVSVLMARSDCTPPAPSSNRSLSNASQLMMSRPSSATSADLTRMNDQLEALGKRHRLAVRSILAVLALLSGFAGGVGYLLAARLNARALPSVPRAPAPPAPTGRAASPARAALLGQAAIERIPEPRRPISPVNISAKPRLPTARAVLQKMSPVASASAAPATAAAQAQAAKADTPVGYGYLTIDTSPWSMVSLAGKPLGQTPLLNVKLPAGSQVLSLRNPEQGIVTSYSVQIEDGKSIVRRVGIE
jgi:serine/threonine-protein kinase